MVDKDPKPPSSGAEAVADGIAAAAAVGVGVTNPALTVPAAGVAAAIAPTLARGIERATAAIAGMRWNNAATLLGAAASYADAEVEEVVDMADGDEERAGLLSDAVTAAIDSSSQRKIVALARALANGLATDHANIDQERMIVRALSDLEEPHIKVLLRLPGKPSTEPARRLAVTPPGAVSGRDAILDSILAVLSRNGLAESDADDVADHWAQYRAHQELTEALEGLDSKSRSRMTEPSSDVHWHRSRFGSLCARYLARAADDLTDGTIAPPG